MGATRVNTPAARANLRITGTSSVAGGAYNKVKIVGEADVHGDMTSEHLSCIGTMEMTGRLQSGRMRIVGTCMVDGNAQAETLKNSGTVTITGDAAVGRVTGSGLLEVKGHLASKEIRVNGHLAVAGDVEAEQFHLRGMLDVGGLLNAGTVDIKLYQDCKAEEIGGERILVRKARLLHPLSLFFRPLPNAKLTVRVVEGDDIVLEHTHADVVRGTKVHIGPGCRIELVEYKEQLEISASAEVANKRQV